MSYTRANDVEFIQPNPKHRGRGKATAPTIDLTTPKQTPTTRQHRTPEQSLFYRGKLDKDEIVDKYDFDEDLASNTEAPHLHPGFAPFSPRPDDEQDTSIFNTTIDDTETANHPTHTPPTSTSTSLNTESQTILSIYPRDLTQNVCTTLIASPDNNPADARIISPRGRHLYTLPSALDFAQCFLYLFLGLFLTITVINMASYVHHQRIVYFSAPHVLFHQQIIDHYNIKDHGIGYINKLYERGPTVSMFLRYLVDHLSSTVFNHMPYVLLIPTSINPSAHYTVANNAQYPAVARSKYYIPPAPSKDNARRYQASHNRHNDRNMLSSEYQHKLTHSTSTQLPQSFLHHHDQSFYNPEHIAQCPTLDSHGSTPTQYHQYPTTRSPFGFKSLFGSVHVTTEAEATIFNHITTYFNKSIFLSSMFILFGVICKELWYSAQIKACKHVLQYQSQHKSELTPTLIHLFNSSIPIQTLTRFLRDILVGAAFQCFTTFFFYPVSFVCVALVYLCRSRFNVDYERVLESYILTIKQLYLGNKESAVPRVNPPVAHNTRSQRERRRARNISEDADQVENVDVPQSTLAPVPVQVDHSSVSKWWTTAAIVWTFTQRLCNIALYSFICYQTATFVYQFYSTIQHSPEMLIEERMQNLSFFDKASNLLTSLTIQARGLISKYRGQPTLQPPTTMQNAKEFISQTKEVIKDSSTLFSTLFSFFFSIFVQTFSALILPSSTTRINPQDLPIYLLHFGYCCLTLFLSYTVFFHMRSQNYISSTFLSFPTPSLPSTTTFDDVTETSTVRETETNKEQLTKPPLVSHLSFDEIEDDVHKHTAHSRKARKQRSQRTRPTKIEYPDDDDEEKTHTDETDQAQDSWRGDFSSFSSPHFKATKSTLASPPPSSSLLDENDNNFANPNRKRFSTDLDNVLWDSSGFSTIIQLACILSLSSICYFTGGILVPCLYFAMNEVGQFVKEIFQWVNRHKLYPLHYHKYSQHNLVQ